MSLVKLFFFLLGGAFMFGGLYGLYNYYRLRQTPLKSPTDVEAGEAIALEGTFAENCPTVSSPFSGGEVPLVYWEISRYRGQPGSEEDPWAILEGGVQHPDILRVESDGYTIPVEMPDDFESGNLKDVLSSTSINREATVIGADEEPPAHIKRFEEDNGVWSVEEKISSKEKRRYKGYQFDLSQDITVYGEVEAESGGSVSASNFKLVSGDSRFLISPYKRSESMKKRIMGSVASFLVGGVWIAVGLVIV